MGDMKMEKRFDAISVEDLIMDFAVQIDKLPKTDGGAGIYDYCWQSGGNASSAIVAMARLGSECGVIGVTGTDPFGVFCKQDMIRHGVDVSHIQTQEGTTTLCICLAEEATQGRSILGKGGTVERTKPEDIDADYICQARAIHTGMPFSAAAQKAAKIARENGVLVSLDAGSYHGNAMEIVPQIDILIMSEMFYNGLFDDNEYETNCQSLLAYGPKVVIVTLGKKGCVGADAEGTFVLPSFSDCGYKIVDTTGAGDVYHGGFLYAYLNRYRQAPCNYELKDCARFASEVSYINCMTLGGRTGIPTLEMVDTFLQTGNVDLSSIEERKAFYKNAMFIKE